MSQPITPAERYDYAASVVLLHEGKYTDHPNDPGGATNYGISLRFLKSAGIDIDGDGEIDIHDIMAMDKSKAKDIYKKCWWDRYHYKAINDLLIATKVFDLAVNMGAQQAGIIVQTAVNDLQAATISVDGILGGKSIGAINALCQKGRELELLNAIRDEAAQFYVRLAKKKPDLKVFLKGWLSRAAD